MYMLYKWEYRERERERVLSVFVKVNYFIFHSVRARNQTTSHQHEGLWRIWFQLHSGLDHFIYYCGISTGIHYHQMRVLYAEYWYWYNLNRENLFKIECLWQGPAAYNPVRMTWYISAMKFCVISFQAEKRHSKSPATQVPKLFWVLSQGILGFP